MRPIRQSQPIMTINTVLQMFSSNNRIIISLDTDGVPVTYKNNEYETIPDSVKSITISKFSAYYRTICGEIYTVINADIY